MLPATKAWLAIAAGIVIWEFVAPEGELLSHGVDRALEKHPWLTVTAVAVTALHLVNALDGPILRHLDPYHTLGVAVGRK